MVLDGGGGRAEGVSAGARGSLLAFDGELGFASPLFSGRPGLGCRELRVPHRTLDGEAAGCEQRLGGSSSEPFVGDGQSGSGGFFLGVLESVDVLGDAGILLPPRLHVDEEGDMSVASSPVVDVARCCSISPRVTLL